MPKITLTHDEPYSGTDPGNGGKRLDIRPGSSADVSEQKAAQLLADFPDRFKKGAKRSGRQSGDTPPAAETYTDIEGDALRALATSRHVEFDAAADDVTIRGALVKADEAAAA